MLLRWSNAYSQAACEAESACNWADLSLTLLGELVHQGGAGHSFASAGRTLNETERRLQHSLHCIHLHTTSCKFEHVCYQTETQRQKSSSSLQHQLTALGAAERQLQSVQAATGDAANRSAARSMQFVKLSARQTGHTWEWLSSGRPGAEKRLGIWTLRVCCSTSWPSSRWYR